MAVQIKVEMNKRLSFLLLLYILSSTACIDSAVVDKNEELKHHNWSYIQKINIPVVIEDTTLKYNLYMNLRHTAAYKYSNIFVKIHQIEPDGKRSVERKEFQLAYPDGEWLGSGSGNIYSYQLLFRQDYQFPRKGKYIFSFEQNMRDNPLREITDVGLRVEPAGR